MTGGKLSKYLTHVVVVTAGVTVKTFKSINISSFGLEGFLEKRNFDIIPCIICIL